MSDRELIFINPDQFERWQTNLVAISNALWAVNDQLKPLDNAINQQTDTIDDLVAAVQQQTLETTKWLASIVEAINHLTPLPPPQPQSKGVIMATFKVGADNPDITIRLTGSGFVDNDTPPNPVGAADIDLSVESSAPDTVSASISEQTVSDDGNSVTANVAVHFGAPASDIAVLTYRATNRDTGLVVAAGTDEFQVQAGEAALGQLTSNVPLTPVP